MFLSKSQVVLVMVLVGAVSCGKWPRPPSKWPRSSEESNSRSISSEEYVGAQVPPLVLGGVPLPTPVHTTGFVDPVYTQRVNPLTTVSFNELIKNNKAMISNTMGHSQKLAYVSKATTIPLPEGLGEMYYVKGYFTNELGYQTKCKFYLYSKEAHAQVLEPRCH